MTDTKRPPSTSRFAAILLDWFAANRRDLPWRNGYTPYHVWISEIMLQQTQMERGVQYFSRWVQRFPDVQTLARADEDEVLKSWEGLGYYSRARNIVKAARILMRDHGGEIPADKAALLALPGIGPYTAGAMLSLAFEQDEPLVDANVARVYARVFDLDAPSQEASAKKALWALAQDLLPPGQARDFNQAVMEFGALVCKPQNPACGTCPAAPLCEAHRLGIVEHRPVPGKKQDIVHITVATGVLAINGRLFIQKRRDDDVWGGLWEFPGGGPEAEETTQQTIVREFKEETGFDVAPTEKIGTVRHGYTKYRVSLHCYLLELVGGNAHYPNPQLTEATKHLWATLDDIDARAFPAGHRKLIDFLRNDQRYSQLLFSA